MTNFGDFEYLVLGMIRLMVGVNWRDRAGVLSYFESEKANAVLTQLAIHPDPEIRKLMN
jgi:hypothetical protein